MNQKFTNLYTAEGETLTGQPWNIYPRPQMKRDSFFCLNGEWDFFDGEKNEKITVPFPPESILSGIGRRLKKHGLKNYRKSFRLPDGFCKGRVLLHFGAVDQTATVILNGEELGTHVGGYEAFSFDITNLLQEENLLEVFCADASDLGILPYGKQREKRGGMWYTPVSGIWQTVWMESVPTDYIHRLKINVGADFAEIKTEGLQNGSVCVQTPEGEFCTKLREGRARIEIQNPRMWFPEDPYLYSFTVAAGEDTVSSYFALRTLEIKQVDGIPRLCLNGKPYFFHGLLDQGYYSDGIFTPATPENYTRDIAKMKALGFNMLRKHIKVEPEQFYYECDRLGMIVFQDMVNNGKYSFLRDTALPTVGMKKFPDRLLHRGKVTRKAFEQGMEATVKQLYNHPCICYWTIFNEGWGQFDSATMYEKLKELDSTRFIDATSGWFKGKKSDVESLHVYFKPFKIKAAKKPIVLSEFGGYSYRIPGHSFNEEGKPYGYRFFQNRETFEDALCTLYEIEIIPALPKGLCAAVYTQVSDVEDETNGLLTYDRKIMKVGEERMRKLAEKLKL